MSNTILLTDSHCHLSLCASQPDFGPRFESFLGSGGLVLDVGIEEDDEERRQKFWGPGVFHSLGIHPNQPPQLPEPDWDRLRERLIRGAAAVGETGLDFYRSPDLAPRQHRWFRYHLEIARSLDLPVIIHCRHAFSAVIEDLKDYPGARGVMHCFSEDWEAARQCLDRGFYLSFAGNLTYPKNHNLQEVARKVPEDRWLVETDAPYLSPHPMRHLKNHPDMVHHTLRFFAQLRGWDPQRAAQENRENFLSLFSRSSG